MDQPSVKLISNIALKKDYYINPYAYLPYDLLPSVFHDARLENELRPYQRQQQIKKLFWTENVIDSDD